MADYPTLGNDFDAATFSESSENVATGGGQTEGGYTIRRARFTRRPRKKFSFKHSNISEAERQVLQTFWDDRKGGSGAFNWTHPITSVTYNVRFGDQMEMEWIRIGFGSNHRWDSGTIVLEEI